MVAHLARLKLRLLVNGFQQSTWLAIGFVFGALYVLGIAIVVAVALTIGGLADPAAMREIVVGLGALLVLGWWVGPVLVSGMNDTLDPRRFVTFGIPRNTLLAGLSVGTLIGIPGVALVIVSAGAVATWFRTPIVLPVALVGAVLGIATCVLGARALTALIAPVMEQRKIRELAGVLALLLGAGVWMAFVAGTSGAVFALDGDTVEAAFGGLAAVAVWTPFGAPWALAGDVSDGAWLPLLARLAIVAATLGLAWRGWGWALTRELHGGARPAEAASLVGLGWFGRLPATPTGAVAARCATYWRRDPRYSASLTLVPLVPVLIIVMGGSLTTPGLMVTAPIVAFLLGFAISADIAYDHTAFALHVGAGVSGRADRWGRALPVLVVGTPLVVAVAVGTAAMTGRWDLLAATLGVSVMTLGVTVAVSSVASALYLYPVPQPGDSPFKSPKNAGIAPMLGQLSAMGVSAGISLPVLVLAGFSVGLGSTTWGFVTAVVGVGLAAGVLVVGVRWGARVYERRGPELLQQVASYQ